MNGPIHISDYASQPEVRIKCTKQYGTPAWRGTPQWVDDLPEGVYALDVGDEPAVLYTFDDDKVTCETCKAEHKCERCGTTADFLVPGLPNEPDLVLCTPHAQELGLAKAAFKIARNGA